MSQKILYDEGVRRLNQYKLNEIRHEFHLDIENEKDLIEEAIKRLPLQLRLNQLERKIFIKEGGKNFSMKWHCDDCSIFKHKDGYNCLSNNIKLSEKYSLYYTKLPKYSMIIYLSTYGRDFTGGEFNFVDKTVKPEKYKVLFFDSREVHKVNTVSSGLRKTILVKFYD